MTKTRYGVLIASAAFAGWWWNRRRTARATRQQVSPAREQGETIFRNAPMPTGEGTV